MMIAIIPTTQRNPSTADFRPSTPPSSRATAPSRRPTRPSRLATRPSRLATRPSRVATRPSRLATRPSRLATESSRCANLESTEARQFTSIGSSITEPEWHANRSRSFVERDLVGVEVDGRQRRRNPGQSGEFFHDVPFWSTVLGQHGFGFPATALGKPPHPARLSEHEPCLYQLAARPLNSIVRETL